MQEVTVVVEDKQMRGFQFYKTTTSGPTAKTGECGWLMKLGRDGCGGREKEDEKLLRSFKIATPDRRRGAQLMIIMR